MEMIAGLSLTSRSKNTVTEKGVLGAEMITVIIPEGLWSVPSHFTL